MYVFKASYPRSFYIQAYIYKKDGFSQCQLSKIFGLKMHLGIFKTAYQQNGIFL